MPPISCCDGGGRGNDNAGGRGPTAAREARASRWARADRYTAARMCAWMYLNMTQGEA
jgi:hypothetical protein